MNTFAHGINVRFAARADAAGEASPRETSGVRAYFLSDSRRAVLSVLGLIWLLDGALQFQSFMYSSGFPRC